MAEGHRRQPERRLLLQPRRRPAHARDYGRIVNIASIAGKEGNPNASAYSASKAAVIGLTKSLGKELAKTEDIRVNAVTPAAVRTPIFDQITQEHIEFMLSKIPMGRFGTVEEIAALVCWLASEECSFTTGAVFDVSGGRASTKCLAGADLQLFRRPMWQQCITQWNSGRHWLTALECDLPRCCNVSKRWPKRRLTPGALWTAYGDGLRGGAKSRSCPRHGCGNTFRLPTIRTARARISIPMT